MNVVISINGREAIPVRAIAWATYSILSPDVLAEDLAKHSESPDHHPPRLNNATAYHLIGNGEVRAMAPREWDYVVRSLSALHKDLKDANLTRSEDRRQWELRATETMPRGTFLWKDEFEAAYQRGYRTRQIREEREGDRGYTCNPIVPECLEPTIMEGFDVAANAAAKVRAIRADTKGGLMLLIGLLVHHLAEKGGKLKKPNGEPNASGIYSVLSATAERLGVPMDGLGSTQTHEKLAAALAEVKASQTNRTK
ncbi:hypothetical protein [uncultured Thiodictyon sp.]|jgi:hypothetical protein|uniref:hypothetical protein n=1 Tax=uncultured Thiodictyon sp. TaxID=1846217 RepID=UPI0025ED7FA2|nr:hypothetical protein [uncultured Thiodictyon sp.]